MNNIIRDDSLNVRLNHIKNKYNVLMVNDNNSLGWYKSETEFNSNFKTILTPEIFDINKTVNIDTSIIPTTHTLNITTLDNIQNLYTNTVDIGIGYAITTSDINTSNLISTKRYVDYCTYYYVQKHVDAFENYHDAKLESYTVSNKDDVVICTHDQTGYGTIKLMSRPNDGIIITASQSTQRFHSKLTSGTDIHKWKLNTSI